MKKKMFLLVILVLSVFIGLNQVRADYTISGDNTAGKNEWKESGTISGGTLWPTPYLKSIRVRIFRGDDNVIGSAYFTLADKSQDCYYIKSEINLCETSSYNYGTVNSTSGVSCSKSKVSLKCIANNGFSQLWNVESFNGTSLKSFLEGDNYTRLKEILDVMGYNETNFNDSDIVIVEPATLVKCAGNYYFGTSTALMKKNVSFRGASGNVCSVNDNTYYDKNGVGHIGYTFQNVFQSMSKAFNVNGDKTGNSYSDTGFKGYGFWKFSLKGIYTKPEGKLVINKVNTSEKNIIGKSATFKVYSNNTCTTEVTTVSINSNGVGEVSLLPGTYYIKETVAPSSYVRPNQSLCTPFKVKNSSGNLVAGSSISITSGNTSTVYVINEQSCQSEFSALSNTDKQNKNKRISLFNKYGFTNLLNFGEINVDKVCSNATCNYSNTTSCLAGNYGETTFDENNWSCYNQTARLQTVNGEETAYCLTTFRFENLLNETSFTSKSGMLYINSINFGTNYIGKGILTKTCYTVSDAKTNETLNIGYQNYIDFVSFANKKLTPLSQIDIAQNNTNNKFYHQVEVKYHLPAVYVKNGSGEGIYAQYDAVDVCDNCKFLGYGFISKLNSSSTTGLPFKIKFIRGQISELDGERESNECEYTPIPELIEIPNSNNLQLVFRTVDTSNPFLSKNGSSTRNPKINWCDESDCNPHNCLVNNVMNNRNNSKNEKKSSPLYTITLTASDIKKIRKYNKQTTYDDFRFKCDGNGENCVSMFLEGLKDGNLNLYNVENDRSSLIDTISNKLNKYNSSTMPEWLKNYDIDAC